MTEGTDFLLGTEITWAEVEERLRARLRTEARFGPSKSVLDIGDGNGFASKCGLITCDWVGAEENGKKLPARVVIKIPSIAAFRKLNESLPAEQRMIQGDDAMWKMLEQQFKKIHNIEVASYNFFQEFSSFKVPRRYFGTTAEGDAAGVLCLEYMENSRMMNFHEVHELKLVRQIARALGRIQAASLKRDLSQTPEFHSSMFEEFAKNLTVEGYIGMMKAIVVVDPSESTAALIDQVTALLPEYFGADLVNTLHSQIGFRPVLVNGDLRTENVLMDKTTGDLAALIDWQVTHVGVGVEDLIRIMLFALPTKKRRDSTDLLIRELYNSLVRNLDGQEPPYDLARLRTYYELVFPHCALFFASGSIMLMNQQLANPALSPEEKEKLKEVELEKVIGSLEDILYYHGVNERIINAGLRFRSKETSL